MHANFCTGFYKNVKQQTIHFTTKFYLIISKNEKIMLSEPRHSPISQRLSITQNWLQANCPGFIDTLQIWTYWTSTSALSCLGCHVGKVP